MQGEAVAGAASHAGDVQAGVHEECAGVDFAVFLEGVVFAGVQTAEADDALVAVVVAHIHEGEQHFALVGGYEFPCGVVAVVPRIHDAVEAEKSYYGNLTSDLDTLLEIKKLVEKYHGNVFITCEDKVFELRIILSNETNE